MMKPDIIDGQCPFCCHDAVIDFEECDPLCEGDTDRLWRGKCLHCGAEGPLAQTEREALNRWTFRGAIDYNKTEAPDVGLNFWQAAIAAAWLADQATWSKKAATNVACQNN